MASEYFTVTTTHNDKDAAEEMAKDIVERYLAACVQTFTMRSAYRWEGKVRTGEEFCLDSKTHISKVEALKQYIKDEHPYEVPEIIVSEIVDGSAEYLQWIKDETSASDHPLMP